MIYLITLEPAENRYTTQWRQWIPEYFHQAGYCLICIDGELVQEDNNSKNFLNPNLTNIWKSEQIITISNLFKDKKIKHGDKFLFFDAWHYGAIALKYMSLLNKISIEIYGIWHAGSYDKNDLLGGAFNQFRSFEQCLFNLYDKNFVATHYHKKLILNKISVNPEKIYVTGLPYNFSELDKYKFIKKERRVIFPHRLSDEKQPYILKAIQSKLKSQNIICVFCQERRLTKDEYYKELASGMIVFSASLQETWGIGIFEGLYLGLIPVVPDRLSYTEMYDKKFKYPSEFTDTFENFEKYQQNLIHFICNSLFDFNFSSYGKDVNLNLIKNIYCDFNNIIKEMTC